MLSFHYIYLHLLYRLLFESTFDGFGIVVALLIALPLEVIIIMGYW